MGMKNEKKKRCVNIDWLEVYCLESNHRYPCNADYFRRQGYLVRERDYGTRIYREMFEIIDSDNNPLVEIRRNPASGTSDFHGLTEFSTHIRVPNWKLYQKNPIQDLCEFLVINDYIFKRIYRIDICYDFEFFDSGDLPERFVRRYMKGEFRKINQSSLTAHGSDDWSDCNWNSLSWGSRTSMVTTKLYDKTKELENSKNDKPWIKTAWMIAGLIDNPMSMTRFDDKGQMYKPKIWRVEFAMMSAADGWIQLEFNNCKKQHKQTIPHKLSMFDAPDKLWQRFQDLAYNYFRFKYKEYVRQRQSVAQFALEKVHSESEKKLQRKDRCRDKQLFHWDERHEFCQLVSAPAKSKPNRKEDILRRRLQEYKVMHSDMKIRAACDVLIKDIDKVQSYRFVPLGDDKVRTAMQIALARRIGGDKRLASDIIAEVIQMLDNEDLL